jgi:hypothetical protein
LKKRLRFFTHTDAEGREMEWHDLSIEERAVCLHESSHATIAELLFWKVRNLKFFSGGSGECNFINSAPNLWTDVVVSVVGAVAERWYRGQEIDGGSGSDREFAEAALEESGLSMLESSCAVASLERNLWPLFTHPAVNLAVRRVARALGERRYLWRRSFVRLAAPALTRGVRVTVRRFCSRLTSEIHLKHFHLEGTA